MSFGRDGGKSPWRALYRRVRDNLIVAAIAPEAQANRRGFDRAVNEAEYRLQQIDDKEDTR